MMGKLPLESSSDRSPGGGADLRGFTYALEALRRQRSWQLDQLRMQLSRIQQLIGEQRQKLTRLNALHAAGSTDALKAAHTRLDPNTHVRTLTYLTRLQGNMAQLQGMVEELLKQQDVLTQDYIRQQQRLEALNRHREGAVHEYASEWLRQQAIESDRDWLARVAGGHSGSREMASSSVEIAK
jgi:flagellar biosynthesis chaperone FliJ